MSKLYERLRRQIQNGLLHVLGAGTINKIISLCSGIFIVRVLSQEDYGMYSYVINIVNIFMLINGLGTLTGLLQFGCMAEDKQKRNAFFHYGIQIGSLVNCFVSLMIFLYAIIGPVSIDGARSYLIIAAAIPLLRYANDSIPTYLRAENENKKYGYLYSLNSALLLITMLVGAYSYGVSGALIARYVANLATIAIGIKICADYRKIFRADSRSVLTAGEKKQFLKYSLITCFNNAVSQLLYNIDIFIIGIVIGSTISIASYKVATTIPFGLSFISTAVITYVYPMFVKNRNDKRWLKSHYGKLVCALAALNGVMTIVLFAFAPLILNLIFGAKYVDAVPCFRILMVGFWISSTFRIPGGNVLDMLLEVKANFIIACASGVLNIIFDVLLIMYMGSIGAAIATTSIYLVTALASNIYLYFRIRRMPESEATL